MLSSPKMTWSSTALFDKIWWQLATDSFGLTQPSFQAHQWPLSVSPQGFAKVVLFVDNVTAVSFILACYSMTCCEAWQMPGRRLERPKWPSPSVSLPNCGPYLQSLKLSRRIPWCPPPACHLVPSTLILPVLSLCNMAGCVQKTTHPSLPPLSSLMPSWIPLSFSASSGVAAAVRPQPANQRNVPVSPVAWCVLHSVPV